MKEIKNTLNKISTSFLSIAILLSLPLSILGLTNTTFAAGIGTIDPDNVDYQWSWSENGGYMNWGAENSNVIVTDSDITGYIWSDNYGWINLAPSQAGVMNDGNGVLSGNAWGENIGYIDFAGITIDSNGFFQGDTTVSNPVLGTINFDGTNFRLYTYLVRGDTNNSDEIDTLDIALMQRQVAGFDMSSTALIDRNTTSDVNCDGSIDTLDLALEQRYVVGFDMSSTTWCDVKFP